MIGDMDWIAFVPSALSAIAAIAAAYAAFRSLTISRESKLFSEQNALAVHHGAAVNLLADVHQTIRRELKPLSDLADRLEFYWPREIGHFQRAGVGGADPRPLRHVILNGAEMLAWHSCQYGEDYFHAGDRMFSILRSGLGETSEAEYNQLMLEADRAYEDFESVFGLPQKDKEISASSAFRWVYYQLINRVSLEDWKGVWAKAREPEGWLSKYNTEYQRAVPVLQESLDKLFREKARLAYTTFPLDANEQLHREYKVLISFIQSVLENDHADQLSSYSDHLDADDVVCLVLFLTGLSVLMSKLIDSYLYG